MKYDAGQATGQVGLFTDFEPDTSPDNQDQNSISNRTGTRTPRVSGYSPKGSSRTQAGPRAAATPDKADRVTEQFLILALEKNPDESWGWKMRAFDNDFRAGGPLLTEAYRLVDQTN